MLLITMFLLCTANLPIIRTTGDLAKLSPADYQKSIPFCLTGTITSCSKIGSLIVSDTRGTAIVWHTPRHEADGPKPGDIVRLSGTTMLNEDKLGALRLLHLETIGKTTPPPPVSISISDIFSGEKDFQVVRLRGQVIDVCPDEIDPNWHYLVVRSKADTVSAFIHQDGVRGPLDRFLNAEVELTGPCIPRQGGQRIFMGPHIELRDDADIVITTPPPSDQFDVPLLEDTRHVSAAYIATLGNRRTTGSVLASWQGNQFLIRTDDGRLVGIRTSPNTIPPKAGSYVEAVGFPESDLFHINLSRARWRAFQHSPVLEDPAEAITPHDILTDKDGKSRIFPEYHGRHVQMDGIIRSAPNNILNNGLFAISCGDYLTTIDTSSCPEVFEKLEIGSVIRINGICVIDVPNWTSNSSPPKIRGFFVVVRRAEDVVVLSRPPWWTPGRLLAVIGSLLTALVGIFIWNVSLRRIAERRGRELFKAEIGKVGAELRVDERTRLAVELHDSLAQNLTAISFQVSSAISAKDVAPAAAETHLANADRMLRSCRTELRRCLWDLRSDTLEERDFSTAVAKTVEPVLGDATVHIRFNVPRARVSDTTAHAVLSIIRELTANAVRHGRAHNVWIAGESRQRLFRFSVRDDGCGFDVSRHPGQESGHFGLAGIRERLHPLDGELALSSSDSGTRAVVTLHLPQTEGASA